MAGRIAKSADSMADLRAQLRPTVVTQLLGLRATGELTTAHVREAALSLEIDTRSVWRWLATAEATGRTDRKPRQRLEVDQYILDLLADKFGNIKQVHEQMVRDAGKAGHECVALSTLRAAIARDLDPGYIAGLKYGIPAARDYNPALRRPQGRRNDAWEGDHKQAPLRVMMPDKKPAKVWVTWFEDRAWGTVMGWAVTAGSAHRGSVLAALRSSVLRDEHYGLAGGRPKLVRIDRGADFLSKTVRSAFAVLGTRVHVVRSPRHKGGVERLNGTAVTRFFADLPGYTQAPMLDHRRRLGEQDPILTFEGFVDRLRAWVEEYNTTVLHRTGVTPLDGWLSDPAPVTDVPPEQVRAFMYDQGVKRKITSKGVELHGRHYMPKKHVGTLGRTLRVRWMPHHVHEVDLYDWASNRYLCAAFLSDEASSEQVKQVLEDRSERDRALTKALSASAKRRVERHAPATEPVAPVPLTRMTRQEVAAERQRIAPRGPRRRPRGATYEPQTPLPSRWERPNTDPDKDGRAER